MGLFTQRKSKKNTLANRVRRAESKAKKIIKKAQLEKRLNEAMTVINSGGKKKG